MIDDEVVHALQHVPIHDRLGRVVGAMPREVIVRGVTAGVLRADVALRHVTALDFRIVSFQRLERADGKPLRKRLDLGALERAAVVAAASPGLALTYNADDQTLRASQTPDWTVVAAMVRSSMGRGNATWTPATDQALMQAWRSAQATDATLDDLADEFGTSNSAVKRRLHLLRVQHGVRRVPKGTTGRPRTKSKPTEPARTKD